MTNLRTVLAQLATGALLVLAACIEEAPRGDAGAALDGGAEMDGAPDDTAVPDAPDPPRDAATHDASGVDGAPTDAALQGCLPGSGGGGSIAWTTAGGLVAYRDASELYRGLSYTHTRSYFERGGSGDGGVTEPLSCNELLFCSDGGADTPAIGPGQVEAAFDHPDVVAAFERDQSLYGYDPRPVDGAVLQISRGGTIYVGLACEGRTGISGEPCVEVPPGVWALAELLRAFDAQQLARGECARVFGG
jgi:hypothetical protein